MSRKRLHWTKSLSEDKWVENIPLAKRSHLPSLQARIVCTTMVTTDVKRYHLVVNWLGSEHSPLVSLLTNDFIGAEIALRDQLSLYGLFQHVDADWFGL